MPKKKHGETCYENILVHDYLNQFGGAERVVLAISDSLPQAPIFVFAYKEEKTFPQFKKVKIISAPISQMFSNSRLFLFASIPIASKLVRLPKSQMTFISTSGWSHRLIPRGPSILYVHSVPRWLYFPNEFFGERSVRSYLMSVVARFLIKSDKKSFKSHKIVIANSLKTSHNIREIYGIDAKVVHPPVYFSMLQEGNLSIPKRDFVLVVARNRKYKNLEFAEELARNLPLFKFIFVGSPKSRNSPKNCFYFEDISDGDLSDLYANARLLLAVAREDFGLTPIEAAMFGTPTLALASGGYLETVVEGKNGWLVDSLSIEEFSNRICSEFESLSLNENDIRSSVINRSPAYFLNSIRLLIEHQDK